MISIIDDNDTPPQFSQTSFVKNVGEDLPVGSEILRITVTDPDTTQGTQTLIIANGNYGNYALNSQTGKSTCSVISYSEVFKSENVFPLQIFTQFQNWVS